MNDCVPLFLFPSSYQSDTVPSFVSWSGCSCSSIAPSQVAALVRSSKCPSEWLSKVRHWTFSAVPLALLRGDFDATALLDELDRAAGCGCGG
eukprot:s1734_g3.t1